MCHPALKRALVLAQRLKDLAVLRRVRDRIDREYARPLDVEALARGVNMAAGQLSRQFRLAYGASPYGYLTARRIERAMAILHRTDLGAAEVRAAVGWSTPGTFGPRFAAVVGVPPGECGTGAGPASGSVSVSAPEVALAPAPAPGSGSGSATEAAAVPPRVVRQVTAPVGNREAPAPEPQLA